MKSSVIYIFCLFFISPPRRQKSDSGGIYFLIQKHSKKLVKYIQSTLLDGDGIDRLILKCRRLVVEEVL